MNKDTSRSLRKAEYVAKGAVAGALLGGGAGALTANTQSTIEDAKEWVKKEPEKAAALGLAIAGGLYLKNKWKNRQR